MTSMDYRLFGFVSALDVPPCFATPIFIRDEQLYVQGNCRNERIRSFEKFRGGSIDIYQDGEPEFCNIGSPFVYCVLERGSRTIFGAREYVARYLKQNLRKYLHAPFFLSEAAAFSDSHLPEAYHLREGTDELEMQIIINSIRDFVNAGHVEIIRLAGHGERLRFALSTREAYVDYFFALQTPENSLSDALRRWHGQAVRAHPRLRENSRLSSCISFSERLFPDIIDFSRSDVRYIRWYTIKILEEAYGGGSAKGISTQTIATKADLDRFLRSLALKENENFSVLKEIIEKVKKQVSNNHDRITETSLLSHLLFVLISFALKLYNSNTSNKEERTVGNDSSSVMRPASRKGKVIRRHGSQSAPDAKVKSEKVQYTPTEVAQDSGGRKVALIIGNSAYKHASHLPGAREDADRMGTILTSFGFDVIGGSELDFRQFKAALSDFHGPAEAKLFFFAGHGLHSSGENYLLPIDAYFKSEVELPRTTLSFTRIVNLMCANSETNIILLDASRLHSPMGDISTSKSSKRFSERVGLAPMAGGTGTYIAFSNRPIAEHGRSVFAQALVNNLMKCRSISIDELMLRVREEVSRATKNRQVPWTISSLVSQFQFKASDAPDVTPS